MATIKKSKKKIIIPIISVVLVIALVTCGGIFVSKDKEKQVVSLTTVAPGAITQTVSATGEVSSGAKKEYKAGSVATVKEVFVKRGQQVKKGDLLATFDTQQLDQEIANLQSTYKDAKKSYDEALKIQAEAKKQSKLVDEKIAKAEETASLPKSDNGDTQQINSQVGADYTMPNITLPSTSNPITLPSTTAPITMPSTSQPITVPTTSAADLIDYDKITQAVTDAVYNAISQAMGDFTDSDVVEVMVQTALKNIDYDALAQNIVKDTNLAQTSAQTELVALYVQKEVFDTMASGPTVATQKQAVETTKSALDAVTSAQQSLKAGWTADFDGIITACDIAPDTQTTILSSGITLENDTQRIVTISLNEYDVHKVKVGMSATVTTAYGTYEGKVTDIAPTATGGSSGSIMDSVGSMAGISGLSSLTDSGAGVDCDILVENPDENIIIGFNANVDIVTNELVDVPCVPISSLILEKDGAYVFVYDAESETATKTKIETGITSDTSYQVLSGVKNGDQIIAAPGTYKEDTIKVKIEEK